MPNLTIENFIDKNKESILWELKNGDSEMFPEMCEWASDIIGSYLKAHFPDNQIEMVRGMYGEEDEHYWIEVDDRILDFTVIQFFVPFTLFRDRSISKLNKDEFYNLFFKSQVSSPFIMDVLKINYHKIGNRELTFMNYAREYDDISEYIKNVI